MELTVEDGTGIVLANAYASVAEVEDILSVNIHSNWSLLADETAKANLIMWASRIIDERTTWAGKKMYQTSGLAWPRHGVRDKEFFMVDDNLVPRQVKIAVALLADHLISGNPETVNTGSNITSLQVDVIAIKFDANLAPEKYPVELVFALKALGNFNTGGRGWKRIVKH